MSDTTTISANSLITEAYKKISPTSERLSAQAVEALPGGITHDLRRQRPYPPVFSHGLGCRKWDVDGNEYVDYQSGHGALLLGHGNSDVVAAVQSQIERGSHLGGNTELELQWAKMIKKLIPSAQRVRFTASGSEATALALRLARAHTGRSKFIRFKGHFHGWQDQFVTGYLGHFDQSAAPGILLEVAKASLVADPGDEATIQKFIEIDNDIAAIIVEPTGGHFGSSSLEPSFLNFLREVATAANIVLIFDEVVTGFRVSPGGAQAHYCVTPDLSTLGKILAGGLSGGAVAGAANIMAQLRFPQSTAAGREKIGHAGTFNANPLSAAAGIAALGVVADTDACNRANRYGDELRQKLNEVLADEDLPWAVYGEFSGFHLFTNPQDRNISPLSFDPNIIGPLEITNNDPDLMMLIRLGMLIHGVDVTPRFSGWISAVHGEAELQITVEALRKTVQMLKRDSILTIRGD